MSEGYAPKCLLTDTMETDSKGARVSVLQLATRVLVERMVDFATTPQTTAFIQPCETAAPPGATKPPSTLPTPSEQEPWPRKYLRQLRVTLLWHHRRAGGYAGIDFELHDAQVSENAARASQTKCRGVTDSVAKGQVGVLGPQESSLHLNRTGQHRQWTELPTATNPPRRPHWSSLHMQPVCSSASSAGTLVVRGRWSILGGKEAREGLDSGLVHDVDARSVTTARNH